MDPLLITARQVALAVLERRIAERLPGVDARLFPLSDTEAVLPWSVARSLQLAYGVPADELLLRLGADRTMVLSAESAQHRLLTRDPDALAPRRGVARATDPDRDWHQAATRLPEAWALLGGPDAIDWGATRVGLIDTGWLPHPAFGFPGGTWLQLADARTIVPPPPLDAPTLVEEPGGGRDVPGQGFSSGHGTRIGTALSGRAAAAPGGPFRGAAPGVPTVPVRIADAVLINDRQVECAQAIDHLVAVGAGAVNISLGVFPPTARRELRDAVNRAYDAGVIVVCAAGNIVDPVVVPARLPRTVAVAATTRAGRPWSGSSFGPEVDFAAPGADLWGPTVDRRGRFGWGGGKDGTSYATAITTGAAALWLTHRRADLLAAYGPPSWRWPEAFVRIARATARPPSQPWEPGAFGTGVLDAAALLQAPLPPLDGDVPSPPA